VHGGRKRTIDKNAVGVVLGCRDIDNIISMTSIDLSNAHHTGSIREGDSSGNTANLDVGRELVHRNQWDHAAVLAIDEVLRLQWWLHLV
jgi:hypothetical protein